jgi:hypothetical protein
MSLMSHVRKRSHRSIAAPAVAERALSIGTADTREPSEHSPHDDDLVTDRLAASVHCIQMSPGVAAPRRPVPPHEPRCHRRGPTGARATRHVYDPAHADPRVLALLGYGVDSELAAEFGTRSRNGSSKQQQQQQQQQRRRRAPRRPRTAPARGAEREELERQKALASTQKKGARVRWRGSIRAAMIATSRGFVAPGLALGQAPASTGPLSGARTKQFCYHCVLAVPSVV